MAVKPISDYLADLKLLQIECATNLRSKGIDAEDTEKFNTLIPKILDIEICIKHQFLLTINSGSSMSFILPTMGRWGGLYNSYEWDIDWGDGTAINSYTGTGSAGTGISHTYLLANTEYTIEIKPTKTSAKAWLKAFGFYTTLSGSGVQTNRDKVVEINGQISEAMIRVNPTDSYVLAWAFYNCSNLKMGSKFNLPQELSVVGGTFMSSMFSGCSSMTMNNIFNLPQELISVGASFCSNTFKNCSSINMNSIFNIPPNIDTVGDSFLSHIFDNCILLEMNSIFNIPQNISRSGTNFFSGTFSGCPIITMNDVFQIPKYITTVGDNFLSATFQNCASLTMNDIFDIPKIFTSIPEYFLNYTFDSCKKLKLNNIIQMTQGITTLGLQYCLKTFSGCTSITDGIVQFFGASILPKLSLDKTNVYFECFANCFSVTEDISVIPQLTVSKTSGTNSCFKGLPTDIIATVPVGWK